MPLEERLKDGDQIGHHADQRGVLDVVRLNALDLQQAEDDHRVLIRQPVVVGRDPPRHVQPLALKETDRDRRVSHIDC